MDGGQGVAGRGRVGQSLAERRLAYGLTLLAVFLWGFSPIGTRYMVGTTQAALPAMAISALRYVLAAAMFLPWLVQARRWSRRDLLLAALCGLLGITGYNLPATIGQKTVSAGLTGLLDGAEPLMIVVFTACMARRRPSWWTICALCLALAGIVLLAKGSGPQAGSLPLGDPLGIALVLFGAVLWAAYCVLVPPLIDRRGALPATAAVLFFGALPLLAAGTPAMPGLLHVMTIAQWAVMLLLVLGASAGATLSWNAGSAGLGAETAGWFLYLVPLVSLIGGAILLGEPIKPVELVGGAMILLSVYLSQR